MKNIFITLISLIVITGSPLKTLAQKYSNMAGHKTTVSLGGVYGSRKQMFEKNCSQFLDVINSAYKMQNTPQIPANLADKSLNETLTNLWRVSPFFSVKSDIVENLLASHNGNFEIRNLQIVFEEADSSYQQQDAVIIFNSYGKITDFKIAMSFHSVSAILRDTTSVTDLRRRQMIINFVEDFRTSYNLKNLDFLENVFSDKAVIITGKVLKKTVEGELKPITTYKRQTKGEYLENLKYLFANTKMINLNFDSITVVQHPSNSDLYGVTLTQTWNSERISGGKYNDVGYVFLIIDFTKEQDPKIWVRTWQDKQFIAYDHGVFNFNHFSIK